MPTKHERAWRFDAPDGGEFAVRAVGIEKSEPYCELAVKRLAQRSLFEELA